MSEDRAMGGLVQLIGAKYVGDETSWCTSVEVTAGPAARQIGDALMRIPVILNGHSS
jgi:hypothetical protein